MNDPKFLISWFPKEVVTDDNSVRVVAGHISLDDAKRSAIGLIEKEQTKQVDVAKVVMTVKSSYIINHPEEGE